MSTSPRVRGGGRRRARRGRRGDRRRHPGDAAAQHRGDRDRHARQPAPRGPRRDRGRRTTPSRSAPRRRSPRSAPTSGSRSCAARSSRSPRRRSATWPRSAATCSSRSRYGDLAVALLALDAEADLAGDGRDPRRRGARRRRSPPEGSSPRCASPRRGRGSTPRRCAAGSTPASIVTVAAAMPSRRHRRPRGSRSAAPAPGRVRAPSAEAALIGGRSTRARRGGGAAAALDAADPFDDAYASAWYRGRVLPVHVRRALLGATACRPRVIELTVNDEPREFLAPPGATLLTALRDQLGLTAAKRGCAQGTCGTCTVPARRRAGDGLPRPGRDVDGATRRDAGGRRARRRASSTRCRPRSSRASPPSAASARPA